MAILWTEACWTGGQAVASSDVYSETVMGSRLTFNLLKTSLIQNVNRKLQYIL